MASEHAQLLIVGGPDDGRVIKLDYLPATLGRDPNCAIRLREPQVSREHMAFITGADGVLCEVLSKRRVEIDGKYYRRGKRVLLDTGDVLKLGYETEALFVAAGDDAEEAMGSFLVARSARAAAEPSAEAEPSSPPPLPEDTPPPGPGFAESEPAFGEPAKASVVEHRPLSVAEMEAQQRQKRTRKITIAVGIYLAVMVVGFIVLSLFKSDRPSDTSGNRPKILSRRDIEAILRAQPKLSADREMGNRELEAARIEFLWLDARENAAYLCVKHYKRGKEYSRLSALTIDDSQRYAEAMGMLLGKVLPLYGEACRDSQQQLWNDAYGKFKQLRLLVPDADNDFYRNVLKHQSYIDRMKDEGKKKGKGFFQR